MDLHDLLTLDLASKINIVVVGDAMLDEYYDVHVERISPEFPIQVLLSEDDIPITKPGGSANVAYQTKHWNVNCTLFACLDVRSEGILRSYDFGICPGRLENGRTPIKRRLYDGSHALVRWDIESPNYGASDIEGPREQIIQQLETYLSHNKADVVILTDYGKGLFAPDVCQKIIDICNTKNVITIVDPKDGPIGKWQGCTIFKPNEKEAEKLSGDKNTTSQPYTIRQLINCRDVIITHAGKAVSGIFDGHQPFSCNTTQKFDVQSVVGAGDCFTVFLAMCVARGFNIPDAVQLAYYAGTAYVSKRHNEPISPYDLRKMADPIKAKILTTPRLPVTGKIVFTNGVYDIAHSGHIETLEFAKKQGDYLVVGVNSDESVKRLKGDARPLLPLVDRMRMLASLQVVDFVIPFEEDTPHELIQRLGNINILVKGADYSVDNIIGADLVDQVMTCPLVPNLSTTKIIERIKCMD